MEPHNLGKGWVGFNFRRAFGRPVKIINDAAMQAVGSYRGKRMLFLGLGTGLGTALIVDSVVEPMELAHLPFKKGRTYEEYVGLNGLKRLGKKKLPPNTRLGDNDNAFRGGFRLWQKSKSSPQRKQFSH